jgi:hypothetical protein
MGKETKNKKIFNLVCEDASHLGGPMGTEYTEYMWSKLFSSKEKAKAYAEKFSGVKSKSLRWKEEEEYEPEWQRDGKELSWDSGPYVFTIKEEKVL